VRISASLRPTIRRRPLASSSNGEETLNLQTDTLRAELLAALGDSLEVVARGDQMAILTPADTQASVAVAEAAAYHRPADKWLAGLAQNELV